MSPLGRSVKTVPVVGVLKQKLSTTSPGIVGGHPSPGFTVSQNIVDGTGYHRSGTKWSPGTGVGVSLLNRQGKGLDTDSMNFSPLYNSDFQTKAEQSWCGLSPSAGWSVEGLAALLFPCAHIWSLADLYQVKAPVFSSKNLSQSVQAPACITPSGNLPPLSLSIVLFCFRTYLPLCFPERQFTSSTSASIYSPLFLLQ